MKFCKTYQNQLKEPVTKLPVIGFKRLKKTLRKCRTSISSKDDDVINCSNHPSDCSVCDGTFFPSLFDEMSAIVDSFNKNVQKLLDPPLPITSIWRYLTGGNGNGLRKYNAATIKEGHYLLIYAMVNAIAFRKILKKYDRVHKCEKGQRFKSVVQVQHFDIIQSPWLHELIAFHINLKDRKFLDSEADINTMYAALALTFDDHKPSMTCELFGSFKIDVDLVCPICLDIVFDGVALTCGHILCYMCACSAASVTIVDGLEAATTKKKCPLCREARVYGDAVRLNELNILLSRRCPEYWKKRLASERVERVRLVKEHWEAQRRVFMGM